MGFIGDGARFTVRASLNNLLGQGGRTYTSGTAAVSAATNGCDFYHTIRCLTATTFTTLTDASADGDTETGVAFPAGTIIYGTITAYKLTSGSVHAYKAINANTGGE